MKNVNWWFMTGGLFGIIVVALLSLFTGCPKPTPGPTPLPSAGGAPPISSVTGGQYTTGGQGTGGYSPGAAGCPIIEYPDTPLPQTLAKKAIKRKLPTRHFRPRGRAKMLQTIGMPLCSGGAMPLVPTPLDQIDGSCTGTTGVGVISTPPFKTFNHFNIPDSLLAYQGGTCEDNGCVICDCQHCPAAYCPATHANDVGSNGSSVAKWMVKVGWLPGYVAADTIEALMTGLSSGKTCMIGVDWYDSMWAADPNTGEIRVDLNSANEGGHEMQATFNDVMRKRVWVRNSWDGWGRCFKKLMTPKSAIDGTGCGYGFITTDNLLKLRFDGDCPTN